MKTLKSSQPSGSPRTPESAFSTLEDGLTFTKLNGHFHSNILPKPPFIIPAVLEALKHNQVWGPLVSVVPGEADVFCAQDIRENGGTLLTNDSDLLIQDLGATGCVSFFWDIVPVSPSSKGLGMTSCKLSLREINDRLGLTNIGGLRRVVFEKEKGRMRFSKAFQYARDSHEDTLNSLEYQSFIKELELKVYIPNEHPVLGVLSSLDPRISEVVVQALLLEDPGVESLTSDTKTSRGPETLSIFLPILIEDRDKKSTWTVSTNVRQIAYSMLQKFMRYKTSNIIEYRTLDPSTTLAGRKIEIPDLEEMINGCAQLLLTLDKLSRGLPSPDMQWFAFAVYQDFEWSTSEERSPLAATLIGEITRQPENTEEYSWALIHFTAQVQACLYSLRLAKQILDVVRFLGQDLPRLVQELHNRLASLPLIDAWPAVEQVFDQLSEFSNVGGFETITSILGIPSIKTTELLSRHTSGREKRKQDNEMSSRKARQKYVKRSPSINPFAVLSEASQD